MLEAGGFKPLHTVTSSASRKKGLLFWEDYARSSSRKKVT